MKSITWHEAASSDGQRIRPHPTVQCPQCGAWHDWRGNGDYCYRWPTCKPPKVTPEQLAAANKEAK